VLSGGGDVEPERYGQVASEQVGGVEPDRDEWELALVTGAIDRGHPVLAICRGAQILNVALGGTLIQDLPSLSTHPHRDDEGSHETGHPVQIEESSRLAQVLGRSSVRDDTFGINTLHHQAVDRLGRGLRAVAWALDGTIEAIEPTDDRPILGVQWHPELLQHREEHQLLFRWVVSCAAERLRRSAEAEVSHDR
jgi:putative glutamine amidotransferase